MWLELLAVLIGFIALGQYFYTKQNDYWKKKDVPHVPQFGILATLKAAIFNPSHFSVFDTFLYNELKDHSFGGAFEMHKPIFIARDPELIKDIFIRDFSHFTDRRHVDFMEHDQMAKKMLTGLRGKDWKELRNTLSPTFTAGRMKRIFHIMADGASDLVKYMQEMCESGESEMYMDDTHERHSLHIITSSAFGARSDVYEAKDSIFLRLSKKMQKPNFKVLLKLLLVLFVPPAGKVMKMKLLDEESSTFFKSFIDQAIEARKNCKKGDSNYPNDFLQLMIELSKGDMDDNENKEESETGIKQKDFFDAEAIFAQSMMFIIAGFDTVSTLLTFCTYELALNPDIQEKLYEEIKKANEQGPITYDRLPELSYLDKVVQETLRKFPPAFRLERQCVEDYQIPGTNNVVENGKMVIVPVLAIHRDEKYYPNPDKFDPERFNEDEKSKRPYCAYMPFGHGPRNCIGVRFALMEAKVTLAELVKNFKYEPCSKTVVPPEFEAMATQLRNNGGTYLKVTPRS